MMYRVAPADAGYFTTAKIVAGMSSTAPLGNAILLAAPSNDNVFNPFCEVDPVVGLAVVEAVA